MSSNDFIFFVLVVKNNTVSVAGLSTQELLHTMCCFKCDFSWAIRSNVLHMFSCTQWQHVHRCPHVVTPTFPCRRLRSAQAHTTSIAIYNFLLQKSPSEVSNVIFTIFISQFSSALYLRDTFSHIPFKITVK